MSDSEDGGPDRGSNAVYVFSIRWSIKCDGTWDLVAFKDPNKVLAWLRPRCQDFVIQLECTDRDGPVANWHYQGFIKLEKKKRAKQLAVSWNEELPGVQISPASNAGKDALKNYCMKDDTRHAGPWGKRRIPTFKDVPKESGLLPWQTELLRKLKEEPDNRSILWIWCPNGNSGKTTMAKFMALRYQAKYATPAKGGDILYFVSEVPNELIYIFGKPRTQGKSIDKTELYQALESVKDGFFMNSKYKCSQVLMDSPHVVVFANEKPDFNLMSADRWRVHEIVGQNLVPSIYPAAKLKADQPYIQSALQVACERQNARLQAQVCAQEAYICEKEDLQAQG